MFKELERMRELLNPMIAAPGTFGRGGFLGARVLHLWGYPPPNGNELEIHKNISYTDTWLDQIHYTARLICDHNVKMGIHTVQLSARAQSGDTLTASFSMTEEVMVRAPFEAVIDMVGERVIALGCQVSTELMIENRIFEHRKLYAGDILDRLAETPEFQNSRDPHLRRKIQQILEELRDTGTLTERKSE